MVKFDAQSVAHIVKFATLGGFAGLVLAGWILALDISAMRTLFDGNAHSILSGLFLSGTMLKGALIGLAIGCTTLPAPKPQRQPASN